jgi:CYTH domain-containing protein
MNKTYRIELRRTFLLQNLPEPLKRSSEHLQFFDNFIENTRLCLRSIRAPHTKEWTWILEQREQINAGDLSAWKVSEIHLNEAEHQAFEIFEGREVSKNERIETNELRFNRYFYQTDEHKFEIDVFLNPLWGLTLGTVYFETEAAMESFRVPDFAVAEVTQNSFFTEQNLIGKSFSDVQTEYSKLRISNYE